MHVDGRKPIRRQTNHEGVYFTCTHNTLEWLHKKSFKIYVQEDGARSVSFGGDR